MSVDHSTLASGLATARAKPSPSNISALFQQLRASKRSNPEVVLEFMPAILKMPLGSLEELVVAEQAAQAACELSDIHSAELLFMAIKKAVGSADSARVNRLYGAILEAKSKFSEAQELYERIIEEHPSDHHARKRLIAVALARKDTSKAQRLLESYVHDFSSDTQAVSPPSFVCDVADSAQWCELADLHMRRGQYREATAVYEELVLLHPHSAEYHVRLAEILCTRGGLANLFQARSSYAQAVTITDEGWARALVGMCHACVAIQTKHKAATDRSRKSLSAEQVAYNKTLFDGALRALQALVDAHPNPGSQALVAGLRAVQGEVAWE